MGDREAQRLVLLDYLVKDAAGHIEPQAAEVGPEMEEMKLPESVLHLAQPVSFNRHNISSVPSVHIREHGNMNGCSYYIRFNFFHLLVSRRSFT